MDISYLLKRNAADKEKLISFGFYESGGAYILKRELSGGFYAVYEIKDNNFTVNVFDEGFDEEYILFNVKDSAGAVVGKLRAEVEQITAEIVDSCFVQDDARGRVIDYIKKKYGADPYFPWGDLPEASPFKNQKGKWFALIMTVQYKKLGLDTDGETFVINLKIDPEKIKKLVDGKAIFPAYHMNKKYWLTVLLDKETDFDLLFSLIDDSFAAVM